ncbi:MAG: type IV secretory system conjugative DNA transfer family protein [Ardenticatenaceae bacterium]|nr:type IV secretory system conjugative DNA transfer family protein [Ardenticatenaceae bacterium]
MGDRPMNLEMGEIKNGTYFKQWWQEMPAAQKKRWRVFLLGFSLFWLAGAAYAPTAVAGIARLTGLARLLMAVGMGGFGFLWGGLKGLGLIQETAQEPKLFWVVLALALPGAIFGFIYILDQAPNPLFNMQKMLGKFARSQGRLQDKEVAQQLAVERGVPYATVTDDKKKEVKVGLDYASGEGHLLVSGPTRSGKGLHLTDTLLTWPGPALVVDPKGEQMARTAAWRSQFGPIYCLPGHQMNLAAYYRQLLDRDDIAELHTHLMRPWESRETIFAEKAMSLFTAAGLYAQAKELDPIRVLLDLAESDAIEALAGLETVPAAKRHVRVFTNGAKPEAYRDDRFVTSAFGNFTTRLATYQKHIDTIAPPDAGSHLVIDPNWARQNGTIYITYSLQDLKGVGGVVAAMIAAMLRHQMRQQTKERLLVAIDELPAVGLKNIADYLATCGGYGITLLLYVQSIAQLKELYGLDGTSAILSNCAHQVWYPPTEYETAETMSRLYGMTLRANPVHSSSRGSRQHKDKEGRANLQTNSNQGASWSWQERPELLPSQVMALPKEQVMVSTLAGAQRLVFLGQRLNPIPLFDKLPPVSLLRLPRPRYGERVYTRWLETPEPPAAAAPPISEHPTPVETPAPDDKDDAAETRPSANDGSPDTDTTTGSTAKDAI